jgi:hypothetical protein
MNPAAVIAGMFVLCEAFHVGEGRYPETGKPTRESAGRGFVTGRP